LFHGFSPKKSQEYVAYRKGYLEWRRGRPEGARGELTAEALEQQGLTENGPWTTRWVGCGGCFFVDFVGKIIQGNHGTLPLKNGLCLIGKIFTNPGHWIGEREKTKCEFTPANMRI